MGHFPNNPQFFYPLTDTKSLRCAMEPWSASQTLTKPVALLPLALLALSVWKSMGFMGKGILLWESILIFCIFWGNSKYIKMVC